MRKSGSCLSNKSSDREHSTRVFPVGLKRRSQHEVCFVKSLKWHPALDWWWRERGPVDARLICRVWYSRPSDLLQRLRNCFGIQGVASQWFTSYLAERKQFVSIASERSASRLLTCGIPQSSVHGQLLYTMYTAPLWEIMRHHGVSLQQYADDAQTHCAF